MNIYKVIYSYNLKLEIFDSNSPVLGPQQRDIQQDLSSFIIHEK